MRSAWFRSQQVARPIQPCSVVRSGALKLDRPCSDIHYPEHFGLIFWAVAKEQSPVASEVATRSHLDGWYGSRLVVRITFGGAQLPLHLLVSFAYVVRTILLVG